MNKWYGWAGSILQVDLANEKIVRQPLTKNMAYNFLGGRGFNIKTLWDNIYPGIDPLGPRNVLCFGIGPLTGTLMSCSARYSVSTKSPETGILGDANAGGYWGPELKFAGFDQIVIKGRAKKPLYLWIDDDHVELREASKFWKSTTYESEKIIKEELGDPEIKVASIGLGGANLVRFASVINDLFRAAARCGVGAVMGSKNLKAIAVRGTKGSKIAKRDQFEDLVKEDRKKLMENEFIQNVTGHLGTPWLTIGWGAASGMFDYKNSQTIILPEELASITGEVFFETYCAQIKSCFNCPVHCSRYYEVKTGPYAGVKGSTCEFETIWSFGVMCGVLNLPPILKCNNLCNQYGLDTISTGVNIAFAMELYEKGILTKKDVDGIELEFGNDAAMIEIIHRIAQRDGFGNILAEGPLNAAKIIGKKKKIDVERYYPHTLGLSRAAYQCYGDPGAVLGTITSTRGADHLRGHHYSVCLDPLFCRKKWGDHTIADVDEIHGKHISITWMQHEWTLADCLERCKCGLNDWYIACPLMDPTGEGRAKIVSAATGWEVTAKKMEKIAERVYNLERTFNAREGVQRKHMRPPWKSLNIPIDRGPNKGLVVRMETVNKLLDNYFKHRGWNLETGVPTESKLLELGLKYVADEMKRNIPYPEWSGPSLWPLEKYPHGGPRAPYP